jgi:hypothetical protein
MKRRVIAVIMGALLWASSLLAHPAWGIVVDRGGNVIFSDLETIWRIDVHGKLTVLRPGVSGRHVHDISIDAAGNLYGADLSYLGELQGYRNAIWRMAPSGQLTWLIPAVQTLPRGAGVWRDRSGNTYAIEEDNHTRRQTLLVRRTPAGAVLVVAGGRYGHADGTGARASFSNVIGGAFGPDGSLYLADGATVRKVTPQGVVTTLAAGLDTDTRAREVLDFASLMGIAAAPNGDVYVADFRNRRVLRISHGIVTITARAEPPWSPTGVAAGPNGDLFLLEYGFRPPGTWLMPRIRKVTADGKASVIAVVPR